MICEQPAICLNIVGRSSSLNQRTARARTRLTRRPRNLFVRPPILEPVSGQVGLRFLGKVFSGCRDRTAITSVEAECENPETKSTGREGANTGVFGAAPGNLRRAATDWWRTQSLSNWSPGLNSLVTGKNTGKLSIPVFRRLVHRKESPQSLAFLDKFPKQ